MGMNQKQLEHSLNLWVKRERDYQDKAAHAHDMIVERKKQLATLAASMVRMPVVTDMAHNTNGWTGPNGHDGIDLICAPNAPLFAMCKSKVVRVSASGWWGNNPQPSPGHPVGD